MSDEQAKKEKLLRILTDVERVAASLETMGQTMIQEARRSRDVAAPLRDTITYSPTDWFQSEQLDRGFASWDAWQVMARHLQASQTSVNSFVASASGAINTTASLILITRPIATAREMQYARSQFIRVLDRSALVDQARSSMTRLGLDARGGNARTALELLEEAHSALERPVINDGGPTSVLMPLRESVDAAITELIRRRSVQEKVTGWRGKVTSLGQQCARSGLSAAHFDRIGSEADELMNRLSGFKQLGSSRDRLNELFCGGVTLLNALLDSIDESKLRT